MRIDSINDTVVLSRLSEFKDYLRNHGCEIQAPSNEYELVRFKSALGIGVLYKGKRGISGNVPFVADALTLFLAGQQWHSGRITGTKRNGSAKRKAALRERDGANCFFCGKHMEYLDVTEEHLVPVSQRGANNLDNIVLAHTKCNQAAGSLSLVDKLKLRDKMRRKSYDR